MNNNQTKIADAVTVLLESIGENSTREGLIETPSRVARSYSELFSGYEINIDDVLTTFDGESYDQIILLENIEFYSMCEHHMLPFFGKAHVAYIPDTHIVGISKLARVVDMFARRLQNQERLTKQIAQSLHTALHPKGVAVLLEAEHFCMRARGVNKQNSLMKSAEMLGRFKTHQETRAELYAMIK